MTWRDTRIMAAAERMARIWGLLATKHSVKDVAKMEGMSKNKIYRLLRRSIMRRP